MTLFTEDDSEYVRSIANLMKKSGDDVPEWMLNLKQCDNKLWKKLEKVPIRRKKISTAPKEHMPKAFLKKMQKNMNRSGVFKRDPANEQIAAEQDQKAEDEEEGDGFESVGSGEGEEGSGFEGGQQLSFAPNLKRPKYA